MSTHLLNPLVKFVQPIPLLNPLRQVRPTYPPPQPSRQVRPTYPPQPPRQTRSIYPQQNTQRRPVYPPQPNRQSDLLTPQSNQGAKEIEDINLPHALNKLSNLSPPQPPAKHVQPIHLPRLLVKSVPLIHLVNRLNRFAQAIPHVHRNLSPSFLGPHLAHNSF